MEFNKAFELLKQGEKIKRQNWSGYWQYDKEKDEILMYCKDGNCLEIRQTTDILYTVGNMAADDWEIAVVGNSKLLEGIIIKTFTFGEAIRLLKQGERVRRQGWNGKGIFLELQVPDEHSKMTHPYIYIDTTGLKTDNQFAPKDRVPWLASQTDMLASDYVLVVD